MRSLLKFITVIGSSVHICLILLAPNIANASDPIGLTAETDFKVGITSIYSPDSFQAWGKIENSSSLSLRLQIWHSRLTFNRYDARLGSELILTHRLNYPVNGISGAKDSRIGIGIIPLNLMMPLTTSTNVSPFAFFSAGGIFLNEKLPEGDGASLNYLLNIGAGFEFPFFQNSKIQLGYSIQHMSNANTGEQNPGIDSHMLFMTILLP
jgi:hypothetical protein